MTREPRSAPVVRDVESMRGAKAGPFATQSEAKGFFVEKILSRAVSEGQPLSADEQRLLRVSASEPESLEELRDTEGEDAERRFESRIAGLLERSYRADLRANAEARAMYRDAYSRLAAGDHYLLVMIERAIGSRPVRRGMAARAGLFLLLVVPGVVAFLFGTALASSFMTNPSANPGAVVAALVFLGFALFLVGLWWRERRAAE